MVFVGTASSGTGDVYLTTTAADADDLDRLRDSLPFGVMRHWVFICFTNQFGDGATASASTVVPEWSGASYFKPGADSQAQQSYASIGTEQLRPIWARMMLADEFRRVAPLVVEVRAAAVHAAAAGAGRAAAGAGRGAAARGWPRARRAAAATLTSSPIF